MQPKKHTQRLHLLLTNTTQYINLLNEQDIDHLLTSLAKTNGLTQQDIQDHLNETYPTTPE